MNEIHWSHYIEPGSDHCLLCKEHACDLMTGHRCFRTLLDHPTRIGKYLTVKRAGQKPSRKTKRWAVLANDGSHLGSVTWFGKWRQYTFDPAPATTFNHQCLLDIAGFLDRINREHRKKGDNT